MGSMAHQVLYPLQSTVSFHTSFGQIIANSALRVRKSFGDLVMNANHY